jgi:hypothetical protein
MEKMNSVSAIKAYIEGDFDGGPGRKMDMTEMRALGTERTAIAEMCAARMTALGREVEIEKAA